jgi:hypothetical protein
MGQIMRLNRGHVHEETWCITAFIYSWIIWGKIDRDVEFILYHIYNHDPHVREKHGNNRGKKNLTQRIIFHNNHQKLKNKIQYLEQMALDLVQQFDYYRATENHASVSSLREIYILKVKISSKQIQIKLLIIILK